MYQNVTGAVIDNNTGLLKITADQFTNLESLFFHIGDATYEFTPNAQIWPRAVRLPVPLLIIICCVTFTNLGVMQLNTAIGGDADSIYLVTAKLGSPTGEGFDFIDGYTFLERFYYVYDSANACVGFATTPFTHATTN